MTREEAAYYYKKSEQAYFDAKIGRNNAENALASYNSQKKSTESSLSSSKSEKKNLEARLEDIRIIISLLENSVSLQISKANHAAEMAGEKYIPVSGARTMAVKYPAIASSTKLFIYIASSPR